jgi:hypothetical protein
LELLGQNARDASRITAPERPQILLRRNEELIVRRYDLAVRIRARFAAGQEVVAPPDDSYRNRNGEPARNVFYMISHFWILRNWLAR